MRPARSSPRVRLLAVLTLVLAMAAVPLGALASHDFADVPDSNLFHADISALAASGVTSGCGGGNYCPSAFVTREQMAAFMNRLGALSPAKIPVVNAARLQGQPASAFLRGNVELSQFGPWQSTSGSSLSPTMVQYNTKIHMNAGGSGEALIHQGLVGPSAIGATNYGFASVEICWLASTNVVIYRVTVWQDYAVPRLDDVNNVAVTSDGCHTWTAPLLVATARGVVLAVDLQYIAAGSFKFVSVTTTWAPVP